jgi:nucleoside-diphosphate-sugar epimerase
MIDFQVNAAKSSRVAVFGAAGAIGRNVAIELNRRGIQPVYVGRTEDKLRAAFPAGEIRAADLSDSAAAERAAAGCDTVLYTVGLPYTDFARHPELMRASIEGAERAGVRRMVVISSVYSYGKPQTARVSESHPRDPEARKGLMRKQQEDIALRAHADGRIRTLVLRLPDFYGPYAEQSLANMAFSAVVKGESARWLGPMDLPHEFIFMPDAAAVIADLLLREDLDGRAWNLGGAGTISGREFLTAAFAAAGHPPKWRTAGRTILRIGGLFSPVMRELQEMFYLHETTLVLDDSALAAKLGPLPKTPYREGIPQTIQFLRTGTLHATA